LYRIPLGFGAVERRGSLGGEDAEGMPSMNGNRPMFRNQQDLAGPILHTAVVLKVLRQAFYKCQEEGHWRPHQKYNTAPDECLTLAEYSPDELKRALKALGRSRQS
jgi:hypothetical protein